MDMLLVVTMLLTLLELSMLPRERLMLMPMPSMVLMDIAVSVIQVSDTLAMVMLLLLSPMLHQLFLMATLGRWRRKQRRGEGGWQQFSQTGARQLEPRRPSLWLDHAGCSQWQMREGLRGSSWRAPVWLNCCQ